MREWFHVEPMLYEPADETGLTPVEKQFVRISDIYAYLPTLYMVTRDRCLRRVLELGTNVGNSLMVLLLAAREVGGHVTTVDKDESSPECSVNWHLQDLSV